MGRYRRRKKIKELEELIEATRMLEKSNFDRFGTNPQLEKFKARAQRTLKSIYGENSKKIFMFNRISYLYTGYRGYPGVICPQDKITYEDGLLAAKTNFEIIIEDIETNGLPKINKKEENNQMPTNSTNIDKTEVFIVHGHDEQLKTEVELFLTKLDLNPIILHKEANMGDTIIEKIERYTDVGFGIVLYTPCDEGKAKNEEDYKDRARQNVVFEHGYLIGKLGREKVAFLIKGRPFNLEVQHLS